jgi:hypothetical protein
MVSKKDGTFRFRVDFRHLNNLTIKDAFPLPRLHETLESPYFSTLDLSSGYWQVELIYQNYNLRHPSLLTVGITSSKSAFWSL